MVNEMAPTPHALFKDTGIPRILPTQPVALPKAREGAAPTEIAPLVYDTPLIGEAVESASSLKLISQVKAEETPELNARNLKFINKPLTLAGTKSYQLINTEPPGAGELIIADDAIDGLILVAPMNSKLVALYVKPSVMAPIEFALSIVTGTTRVSPMQPETVPKPTDGNNCDKVVKLNSLP